MNTTSDPYDQTGDCPNGHHWVAGMMRVHPEDLYAWKATDRRVTCEACETVFKPNGGN